MPAVIANYSFSFNNQVFGGAGSPYQILEVEGLESLPGIRNQDDNRGYADGMFTGRDFLGGRIITMTIQTTATSTASAQANFNTLQRTLQPQTAGTTPLYFILSAGETEQVINARVRSHMTAINPEYTYGYIISQAEFFCPDPRYYDSNEQTATLAFSVPSGRIYNRTYNLVYGGGSGTITTTITNTGWTDTYPIITINGPINNPEIGNATQGAQMLFNVVLSSSDAFVIDLYNKLITLNGNPARNTLISGGSTWFSAQPGNNAFYFTGTGTLAGTTQAVVEWQSAYI
jgi:phage-related protein